MPNMAPFAALRVTLSFSTRDLRALDTLTRFDIFGAKRLALRETEC